MLLTRVDRDLAGAQGDLDHRAEGLLPILVGQLH